MLSPDELAAALGLTREQFDELRTKSGLTPEQFDAFTAEFAKWAEERPRRRAENFKRRMLAPLGI